MAKTAKPGGNGKHREIVATPEAVLPLDMERMSPAEREVLMRIFRVTGTAAAAAMQVETERHERQQPEYYGRAPTDLRREFSPLPRPRQGAGLPRRKP